MSAILMTIQIPGQVVMLIGLAFLGIAAFLKRN
jgi:hypothetical protein